MRDARRLIDESERSQCRYDRTRYAHDTEHYRAECERLLGRRSWGSKGHGGVTDRAQRMTENGEALKYIDLVLRQLRRASRDHQELVRQRHVDFQYEINKRINETAWRHYRRDRREDSTDVSRTWSRSSSLWESDLALKKARPDVTTRLLTKRKNYGGTAQSTVDILRSGSARSHVQDGITAAAYQEMKYIPGSGIDWKEARESFGAWSLPKSSSSNDQRTSSTVV